MSKNDKARDIQAAIAHVLRQDWNPIAVEDLPANEYDGYVGGVYRLLVSGADLDRVAAHLAQLERVAMGLPARDPAALRPVALKLQSLDVARTRRKPDV